MLEIFREKLFAANTIVALDPPQDMSAVYLALLGNFGIKMADDKSFSFLSPSVLRDVEQRIGKPLGEPFYRSFPESVKKLSAEEQIIDRLLHYSQTYGEGNFDERHFSVFEEECAIIPFREKTEKKVFAVVDEKTAFKQLFAMADRMLCGRHLNDPDMEFLLTLIEACGYRPGRIDSKQVLSGLLLALRDRQGADAALSFIDGFANFSIGDVLRVLGYETARNDRMGRPQFRKLNMSAAQRKFYAALIEHAAAHCTKEEIVDCVEKRADWKGFLHHLHFKAASSRSRLLVRSIFDDSVKSVYSEVERLFASGGFPASAKTLREKKGATVLLRHLKRYLAATEDRPAEREAILKLALDGSEPVVKMQFALSLSAPDIGGHFFLYDHYGRTIAYRDQRAARPQIGPRCRAEIVDRIRRDVEQQLAKTDKKYYIADAAKDIALPLWADAQSGMGVMPTGSRIGIPEGKIIRTFVYWEKEPDLDLSGILVSRTKPSEEFSWRIGREAGETGIAFSGDVTDGVNGGAEYFDIDPDIVAEKFPDHSYLIFSVNNYSFEYDSFADFPVRAGFMMRDALSSGEIFEPSSVESSFELTTRGRMAVMFAVDIRERRMVWINRPLEGGAIAAMRPVDVFFGYIDAADLFNLKWFFESIAGGIVSDPKDADVIVSDPAGLGAYEVRADQEFLNMRDPSVALPFLKRG